ncbi:MAG: isocitrate dehydrogenase kinase/phosphatase AceK regulatory subunit, partial [Chloroflexota bacterium]
MENYLAKAGAQIIRTGFDTYQAQFRALTRRAKSRFENRDGHGMRRDAAERLDIYGHFVTEVETRMRGLLGEGLGHKRTWEAMKDLYSGWITDREDGELAETFFNSITRRLFTTAGVNPDIEFVKTAYEKRATNGRATLCHVYERPPAPYDLALSILTTYAFAAPYQDLGRDAHLVGAAIESHWQAGRISFQHVER